MNKFSKVLTMLTVSLTLVTPLFAQEVVSDDLKGFTNVTQAIENSTKNPKKHELSVKIVDKYNNFVEVSSKYEGTFSHFSDTSETKKGKIKTVSATRDGYKPVKFDVEFPKSQTIVLEPTSVNQVTMGKIILPESAPKDNWWIELTSVDNDSDDKATKVTLNVKPDGTFKFLNLHNGNYKVRIFRGEHKDGFGSYFGNCIWDESHVGYVGNLKVSGNVNTTFDLRNTVVDAVKLSEYGKSGIDYSNPEVFISNNSTQLLLDKDTQKIADETFNNNKDLSTIQEILRYMLNNYRDNNIVATDTDMIASDIVKQGYGSGCTQLATLFQAFAEYKGIPTVMVSAVDVNWVRNVKSNESKAHDVKGHNYVECYVDGKWVLVDPTSCRIVEDYNPLEQNIINFSTNGTIIEHVVTAKVEDISSLRTQNLRGVEKTFAVNSTDSEFNELGQIFPSITVYRTE